MVMFILGIVDVYANIGFGGALIERWRLNTIHYSFVYVPLNYMIKTTSHEYFLEQIMRIVRKNFGNKVKH